MPSEGDLRGGLGCCSSIVFATSVSIPGLLLECV